MTKGVPIAETTFASVERTARIRSCSQGPGSDVGEPGPVRPTATRTASDVMRRNGDCAIASWAGIDSQTRTSTSTRAIPVRRSYVLQHTARIALHGTCLNGSVMQIAAAEVPALRSLRPRDRPTRFGQGRHVRPDTDAFTPSVSGLHCFLNAAHCKRVHAFNAWPRSRYDHSSYSVVLESLQLCQI